LSQPQTQTEKLTWFRFGKLADKVVLTSDTGAWHALDSDDFASLIAGSLEEDDSEYEALTRKGFIRQGFDLEIHAEELRRAKRSLFLGTTHHRIHLSSTAGTLPMDQAKAIIDHVFTCHGEDLTFTLVRGPQSPDPGVIAFLHEFAEQKNQYEQRGLSFELQCALSDLDDALIEVLIAKRIYVRAPFDGAVALHDAQCQAHGSPEYSVARERIRSLHAAAEEAGLSGDAYSVFAEVYVGATAPGHAEAVVTGLTDAGIRGFQVIPILEGDHAIAPADYGLFVQDLLRSLNARPEGAEVPREVQAYALIAQMRSGGVADQVLMSTEPSTGFNARSYSTSGDIFPSCSALELHEGGDPIFLIGNVATATVEDISNHPTIRSLVFASLTDCLPGYQHLWSAPYIGVDPVAAYIDTGDLFPKMPTSLNHQASHAMVEAIFLHLLEFEGAEE